MALSPASLQLFASSVQSIAISHCNQPLRCIGDCNPVGQPVGKASESPRLRLIVDRSVSFEGATFDVTLLLGGRAVFKLAVLHDVIASPSRNRMVELKRGEDSYAIEPYITALGAIDVADRLAILGEVWIAPTNLVALESISEHKYLRKKNLSNGSRSRNGESVILTG